MATHRACDKLVVRDTSAYVSTLCFLCICELFGGKKRCYAEKQESRPMWKRKRYRAESIARARAVKAAKRTSDGDVEVSQPGPSTSVDPELRMSPSVDPEAGVSRSIDHASGVPSSEDQGDEETSAKQRTKGATPAPKRRMSLTRNKLRRYLMTSW